MQQLGASEATCSSCTETFSQAATHIHAGQCLSQGQDGDEVFQGRERHRYGLACSSPDLNPIENVWKILGDVVSLSRCPNQRGLWARYCMLPVILVI